MLNISQDQALKRYETLPQSLKDHLFSDYTSTIISRVAAENHLSEDKGIILGVEVGDVIMGFLHPDDLQKEIAADLGLDPKTAETIALDINQKIISPLRTDIDKNYNPTIPTVAPEEFALPAVETTKGEAPLTFELKEEKEKEEKETHPFFPEKPVELKPDMVKSDILTKILKPSVEAEKARTASLLEPAAVPLEPKKIMTEETAPLKPGLSFGELQIEIPLSKPAEAAPVAAEFELGNKASPISAAANIILEGSTQPPLVPSAEAQGILGKGKKPAGVTAPKVAATRLETPRTVHYSEFRTPISGGAARAATVQEKKESVQEKPEAVEPPLPAKLPQTESQKTPPTFINFGPSQKEPQGPELSGNVVKFK